MAGVWNRAVTGAAAVVVLAGAVFGQADPASEVREADRGRAAYVRGDWGTLADAAGKIMAANPWHGDALAGYGHAMLALGRPADAVEPLERALAIGHRPAAVQYNLACAYAQMGKTAEAMAWLERAIDAKFNDWALLKSDTDLDALRAEARFKELLGTAPEGLTREQKWAHDLDFLAWRMERLHYDLYAKVSREEFRGDLAKLTADAGRLTDAQLALGLQKTLAKVGDGHTHARVAGEGSPVAATRYPVAFFWFADGLFVRAVNGEAHESLLGAKVLTCGGVPVDEALARASVYVSHDNEMGVRQYAPLFLGLPAAAEDMGLCGADGRLTLGVEHRDGTREEVTVEAGPGRWEHTTGANTGASAPRPLYLAKADEKFGFEHLKDEGLVYVWLNEISNAEGEPLEHFFRRVFEFIGANGVEALVIDVRNNGGGNNFLNRAIVREVIRSDAINRKGRFFVITGRLTFSAAANLVADLDMSTEALIVGEPAGAGPNFVGEMSPIDLPCSGLRVSCSSLYWQRGAAQDYRTIIWPDIAAERTMDDFVENRDPALEAVLEYLRSERQSVSRAGE